MSATKKTDNGWTDLPGKPGTYWMTWGVWRASDGWVRWEAPRIVEVTDVRDGLVLSEDRVLCDRRDEIEDAVWCARFQPCVYPGAPWMPRAKGEPAEFKPRGWSYRMPLGWAEKSYGIHPAAKKVPF